jgi:hypothetical protein
MVSIVGQQGKFGQHFPQANSMWLQLPDAQVNHMTGQSTKSNIGI